MGALGVYLKQKKKFSTKVKIRSIISTLTTDTNSGIVRVLDIAKRLDARFTFFITGFAAERHPEKVKRIFDAGHEVASHSYLHKQYSLMSEKEIEEDLRKSVEVFKEMGIGVKGFRPPYLEARDSAYAIAAGMGIEYVSGKVAYEDSVYPNKAEGNAPYKVNETIELPISAPCDWELVIANNVGDAEELFAKWKSYLGENVTFLMHPNRMGGKKFAPALEKLVGYAKSEFGVVTALGKAHGWKGVTFSFDIGDFGKSDLISLALR